MKKIRDVVCYYAPYDNMHTGNSSYAGKVILKEDDTFEGLVKDYRQEELYLVFGHMNQDEIEFVQTTKMDKRLPKVYRVKKEGFKYYGNISAKTSMAEAALGECGVYFSDPDIYREVNYEGEIIGLEDSIQMFKKDLGMESRFLLAQMSKEKNKVYTKKTQK